MTSSQDFIDHYAVLQLTPDCNPRALETAYRHFAKLFHPDHSETADVARFSEVVAAYGALRDPDERAQYDQMHSAVTGHPLGEYFTNQINAPEQKAALDDAQVHATVLRLLYERRRENSEEPGLPHFSLQEILECSDENFAFHMWYLKEKGFISGTEHGTLAITIDGVDHIISSSRAAKAEKLRLRHMGDPGE